MIVRTLMYFSIALETAIGPNNVFILGFSKLSAISIRPKFAIVNVEFNLFIPAVDLPPLFGSPALYVKRMQKWENMICLGNAPVITSYSIHYTKLYDLTVAPGQGVR